MKRDLNPQTPSPKVPSRALTTFALQDPADAPAAAVAQPATYKGHKRPVRGVEGHDNLVQRVQLFLASSNLPALRHLAVEIDGDAVVLRGHVQTYYEKQLAVEFSRRVAGVIRVIDLIDVRGYVPRVDGPHTDRWGRASFEPSALG